MATHRIICGKVEHLWPVLRDAVKESGNYAATFLDPPDGVGKFYRSQLDKRQPDQPKKGYIDWLGNIISEAINTSWTTWVSYNSIWDLALKHWAHELHLKRHELEIRPFVQTYTFYQHRNDDCGRGFRPMLRIRWPNAPLYPDQIREPSWREVNGDKRASGKGKVGSDWFNFARVTGNSKQRRAWHITQLNEKLVERCILMSTQEGDTVLDLFSGTGTAIRVCKRLNRNTVSIDCSQLYCEKIAEEHGLTVDMHGAANKSSGDEAA